MRAAKWREEVLWLARKIIFHDPTARFVYKGDPAKKALIPPQKSLFNAGGRGLPIGNLTSQFFGNVYLNELDQFVKNALGAERYIRYVDDFLLVHEDKEWLLAALGSIDGFLREWLDLRVHPKKIYLQEARKGVDFLGYFIRPTHALVRDKVVRRLKNKLGLVSREAERLAAQGGGAERLEELAGEAARTVNSYFGHFGHASSFRLRRHVFDDHCPRELKKFFEMDGNCKALRVVGKVQNPGVYI